MMSIGLDRDQGGPFDYALSGFAAQLIEKKLSG